MNQPTITYAQRIDTGGGWIEASGHASPAEATKVAVAFAIAAEWKPRRWWQFWQPSCPAHVRAEYERQTNRS